MIVLRSALANSPSRDIETIELHLSFDSVLPTLTGEVMVKQIVDAIVEEAISGRALAVSNRVKCQYFWAKYEFKLCGMSTFPS